MYEPGSPRIMVNPLLWDGEEDASTVVQAIVRELIQAVEALPTPDGSQTKSVFAPIPLICLMPTI
jgi:hypothetical protein